MRTPRSKRLWLLSLAALLCACTHSSGGTPGFDPFVTNLISNQTSDRTQPVDVEGRTFVFPQSDTAFDDILPPDTGPVVGP